MYIQVKILYFKHDIYTFLSKHSSTLMYWLYIFQTSTVIDITYMINQIYPNFSNL